MVLDKELLEQARVARDRLLNLQHDADTAKVDYHHLIRVLHASGASMREIAEALGMSHQRVHQIVDGGDATTPGQKPNRLLRRLSKRTPTAKVTDQLFGQLFADSRQAIAFAQEEARQLRQPYLGTEHLLLGLLRAEHTVAARVLVLAGLDVEQARDAVVRIIGRGAESAPETLNLTPRTKKVLDLAVREAKHDRSTHVRSEHLLLALLREGQGVAAKILAEASVDFEAVRKRIGWAGLGCAFCGRGGLDVGKLIAGPGLYVCDRCVGDAIALVTGGADQRGTLALVPVDTAATCNFCGKAHTEANRVAEGPSAKICRECLELCGEILAQT
ncbi:ClpX C4-type zinc finger protein [Tenggerimyces flavus]|uniref:Clp protease N-terminal domain-containing protein n=1 Tax=Tenggerimyces flavus TaxID=1708749 RepID=A0ABV7YLF3_9ACTN|nr:ClpX C4-type zinc finger protein [Tenggerimyces flavus]MBM7789437.1 hypothetical protein [Tenggerimyces flavus]